jgi:hypothetical protein
LIILADEVNFKTEWDLVEVQIMSSPFGLWLVVDRLLGLVEARPKRFLRTLFDQLFRRLQVGGFKALLK